MSPAAAKANLASALEDLRRRIDAVKDLWDDQARRRFERDFIDPLDQQVRIAASGMDILGEIIAAARRDCGDQE